MSRATRERAANRPRTRKSHSWANVKDPHRMADAMELQKRGLFQEAGAIYDELDRKWKGHPEARYMGALILHAWNDHRPAIEDLSWVVLQCPKWTEAHYNLGVCHHELGDVDQAEKHYRRALQCDPFFLAAHNNLANVHLARGEYDQAREIWDRSLAMNPADPQAAYNKAHALLTLGRWDEGWPLYETRYDLAEFRAVTSLPHDLPRWKVGDTIRGKDVLLYHEQGAGDTLQTLRFLPWVMAQGPETVFLRIPGSLHTLVEDNRHRLAPSNPDRLVITPNEGPLPGLIDLAAGLMSLHALAQAPLEDMPGRAGYLRQYGERYLAGVLPGELQAKLAPGAKLRVGVVWAGSPGHKNDRNRSISLDQWWEILGLENVAFFSLQVGPNAGDLAKNAEVWSWVEDLSPYLVDYRATAAVVSNLDLVVGVDTSVVHLAGALGVPAWVIVNAHPDFRWLLNRTDSVLYDSVKVWRQPYAGDWAPVLDKVASTLDRAAWSNGVNYSRVGYDQ